MKKKDRMAMIGKIVQAVTYWPTYFILIVIFNYRVEGQDNLTGLENGSVIFASNHGSWIDGPLSAAAMPRRRWWSLYPEDFFAIRFSVNEKYYRWNNPFPFLLNYIIAIYVRLNGSISVAKSNGDLDKALSGLVNEIKKGEKVWIYPEGGITNDGRFQTDKGKRGVAYLCEVTKCPVVPVAIIGNFNILNFSKTFLENTILRKKKLIVRIGEPIYSIDGTLEEKTRKVMLEIEKLLY